MKEQIIETAGMIWQFLGQNGATEIGAIAKGLKMKNDIVLQSLGWLARESKIEYTSKSNKTFVSLTESEKNIFDRVKQNIQNSNK